MGHYFLDIYEVITSAAFRDVQERGGAGGEGAK